MTSAIRRSAAPQENYFVSMNDLLVGMLFVFIILLMTYALIFEESVDRLEAQLQQRTELRTALLRRLEERLAQNGFDADVVESEGVLRLSEEVLFDPGQASLDTRAQDALKIIASSLTAELPCYGARAEQSNCKHGAAPIFEAVYVEGHTDDIPINNNRFRSNWELSSTRAIETYNYMLSVSQDLGKLPNASGTASLLGASAYADSRPVSTAKTVGDRKKNRRVDFRFLLAPPSDADVKAASAAASKN